ncbi:amidase [Cupriavidus sp. TA19]|uniref:amidase family protein n=1 Tax=unclassified Cupriavidus TaxID=2640874 RepID=UPI0027294E77|nr:amidase family protein [Cupriavidus sp. TA19]GLC92752.1 amidase [Cupriavidus sp. TA19]
MTSLPHSAWPAHDTLSRAAVDPFETSLAALADAMRSRRISAQALVGGCLARIAAYDRAGPCLNAISEVNPSAMREARALDEELRTQGPRSALHGIPMVVKDNIDTAGMPTTAGCAALSQAYPPADAACVARLRAAGAIVLAKANMSELAASNGRFGYSSANGLTLNPYRLSRNASGSSSGSGAAVAASLAAFGLGTDTFGSVRGPACVHALAGLRPTHGLLDNAGVLPLAASFDTVGPLGRSAADVALVMDVLAPGQGFGAPATLATLAGRRLGIVTDFAGGNDEIDALFDAAVAAMQAGGAHAVPVRLPISALTLYADLLDDITRAEWVPGLDRYLRLAGSAVPRSAAALLASLQERREDDGREVNPLTLAALRHACETRGLPPRIDAATARCLRHLLDDIMHSHRVDALVFPTLACPASPRYDMADATYHCRAAQPLAAMHIASTSGMPEVSVPMGFVETGVPAGVSWLGPAGSDAALLAMAVAFEQQTRHRRAPATTPALP